MKTFSPNMRAHCVGRYLIDLPEDMGEPRIYLAQFYYGLDKNFKKVEATMPQGSAMTFDEFRAQVTERMKELKTVRQRSLGAPMLVHSELINTPNGDAVLFRRHDREHGPALTVVSEVHAYVNDRHLQIQTESFPPEEKYRTGEQHLYVYADPALAEERLKNMVRNLRAVKDQSHAGDGFCMNGIVFDAQRIGYDEEKAVFEFEGGTPESPLSFSVSMNGKTGQERKRLLDQANEEDAMYRQFAEQDGIVESRLRHGERRLAGMNFDESALQSYNVETRIAKFRFSARNVQEEAQLSWSRPAIVLRFDVGWLGDKRSPSMLGRHQSEVAWDTWLKTLRLSPGNGGPAPEPR